MIFASQSISKKQVALILADLIILAIAPFLSLYIYFAIKLGFELHLTFINMDRVLYFSNILVFLTVFYIMELYNFKKNFATVRELLNILFSLCIAFVLSVFLSYLSNIPPYGRGINLIYMSVLALSIVGCRIFYSKLTLTGTYKRKTIVVGASKGGQAFVSMIKDNPHIDIDIVCLLDIDKKKEGQKICEIPVVCQHNDLIKSVKDYNPTLLILAMRSSRYENIMENLIWCSQQGIEIRDMTSIYEELTGKIPLKYISSRWLLFSHLNQPKFYFKRIKKFLEIIFASIILIIFSPIMLITALALKLDSKGPIFFQQQRVGKDEKNFNLIKFRSMIEDAEKGVGATWAQENDKRVTSVGKIIRFLRIDELPQLFNVIKGDMSLVGPRPERPEFVAHFLGKSENKDTIIPFYKERLSVKPGVTGWAQVMYPYASSHGESIQKLEYDLYYIKNMSFSLDVRILLKTIRVVIFGRGAK